MKYLVEVKEGYIHNLDDGPGTELVVGESEFNAFRDKFRLVNKPKPPKEPTPKPPEEPTPSERPEPTEAVTKAAEGLGVSPEELAAATDEEIISVPGIGPAKLAEIRDWLAG